VIVNEPKRTEVAFAEEIVAFRGGIRRTTNGHCTSVTELSGRSATYGYDNLYRLTSETIASDPNSINGAVSYTYDAVGRSLDRPKDRLLPATLDENP
jgi:YD repeat-containing protein